MYYIKDIVIWIFIYVQVTFTWLTWCRELVSISWTEGKKRIVGLWASCRKRESLKCHHLPLQYSCICSHMCPTRTWLTILPGPVLGKLLNRLKCYSTLSLACVHALPQPSKLAELFTGNKLHVKEAFVFWIWYIFIFLLELKKVKTMNKCMLKDVNYSTVKCFRLTHSSCMICMYSTLDLCFFTTRATYKLCLSMCRDITLLFVYKTATF